MWSEGTVELRPAGAEEAGIVRDLAALDDAPALEGQVLLALIDGRAVAALSLDDGRVVANPFVPTVKVVAVLRMRAEQLSVVPRRGRLGRVARLRLA
ncbi:MAG TPA: hypothetical protein VG275_10520 [Solirubrobacteraceae bacterium]|nr:hypothetical protein [Solirubrobacteraceae bacterium]